MFEVPPKKGVCNLRCHIFYSPSAVLVSCCDFCFCGIRSDYTRGKGVYPSFEEALARVRGDPYCVCSRYG